MGVDHGCDGIRRVVKAIHELKAERNQKGNEEQKIGEVRRNFGTRRVNIDIDAVGNEERADCQNAKKQYHGQRVEALIEIWS